MKIILFRNYKEEEQLSMKGYADCISEKLKERYPQWDIINYYPRIIGKIDKYKSRRVQKFADFFNRYFYYPLQIKNLKADVYHIIDHGNALFIKRLDAEKTVVTCHDLIPLFMAKGYFPKMKRPPFALHLFKYSFSFLKRARYIFADSENTMKDLKETAGITGDKIAKIPLAPFYPFRIIHKEKLDMYSKKFGIPENKLIILNVGASFFYKNIDGIVKTLRSLPEKINDKEWIFYHVGGSYSATQLSSLEPEFMKNHIKMFGILGYEELEFFYNIADVLFFPSLYEGFGMPVLEAMNCGLPVVTSSVASLVEVGGDAVIYVNPHDVQDMTDRLVELLSNFELKEKLIKEGFKQAQLFNWDSSVEKMAVYYKEIKKI